MHQYTPPASIHNALSGMKEFSSVMEELGLGDIKAYGTFSVMDLIGEVSWEVYAAVEYISSNSELATFSIGGRMEYTNQSLGEMAQLCIPLARQAFKETLLKDKDIIRILNTREYDSFLRELDNNED